MDLVYDEVSWKLNNVIPNAKKLIICSKRKNTKKSAPGPKTLYVNILRQQIAYLNFLRQKWHSFTYLQHKYNSGVWNTFWVSAISKLLLMYNTIHIHNMNFTWIYTFLHLAAHCMRLLFIFVPSISNISMNFVCMYLVCL